MNIRSIAKRYAEAFYADYKASGDKKTTIWSELDELAKLEQTSEDFQAVVKSPLISDDDKLSVFQALNKNGKICDTLFKYISLLIKKKRLMLLSTINEEVHSIMLEELGEVDAVATFATKADKDMLATLEKKLTSLIGKKVNLHSDVDEQIIGGVKIKLGSILYDASVKGQLDKLKASLV